MKLTSPAFKDGQPLPSRFTGDGRDISPPLEWTDVPGGVISFALICEDLDSPRSKDQDYPFVHWIAYGIPPTTTTLSEGIIRLERTGSPASISQGTNSFRKTGYWGPAPPTGSGTHRYVFTLYAVGKEMSLFPSEGKHELLRAIKNHVLATAELTGTYERAAEKKSA